MGTNRRSFLKTTAAASAAFAVPTIWTQSSTSAQQANDRITVASIGVGGSRGRYNRGGAIARNASKLGQTIAVCDVDDRHTAEFNKALGGKLNMYRDYRDLLEKEKPDVVTIGTPDHWHVPIALAALRAGADVYCEKPLTLTIDEGIEVSKVVKETGCVFQVGTQQRSENGSKFLQAVAIVQSGVLGDDVKANVAIGGAPGDGPFESTEAPTDLDWNMWVGPAPSVDYCEERRRFFRWYFEYSGGKMTDWGAHHIDIAQWALGMDNTGPIKVTSEGKFPGIVPDNFNWAGFLDGEVTLPNGYNTANTFHINLEFANGATLGVHDHYKRDDGVDFGNGILLEGSKGRIFVNRSKIQGAAIDSMTDAEKKDLNDAVVKLYKGNNPGNHMKNFFDSVESREQPISDVETHHRTMTSCHLCNIALMLGRDLRWDPSKEMFPEDDQANALKSRKSRQV
jgi:myo-inositol 2-dehydrogenase / D-chiro-inositol 1-dehydrogenase